MLFVICILLILLFCKSLQLFLRKDIRNYCSKGTVMLSLITLHKFPGQIWTLKFLKFHIALIIFLVTQFAVDKDPPPPPRFFVFFIMKYCIRPCM